MTTEQFRLWLGEHLRLQGERERAEAFSAAVGEIYDPMLCDVRWNEGLLNADAQHDFFMEDRVTGAGLLSRFLDAATGASAGASAPPPDVGDTGASERQGVSAERDGAAVVIRILMHGTHEQNVSSILRQGLLEGKSSRAGRKFWFTTDAGTAVCYACPGRRVVICAVLAVQQVSDTEEAQEGGKEAGSLERAFRLVEEKHHIVTTDDVSHQVPLGSARICGHVAVRSAWPRANRSSSSSGTTELT